MDAPLPGGLGGTYGGNAIGCAAALAVLDAFEQDGLVDRARRLGEKLESGLRAWAKHPEIGVVRGKGYMRAMEFVTDPRRRGRMPIGRNRSSSAPVSEGFW